MPLRLFSFHKWIVLPGILIGAPFLGLMFSGQPLGPYLEFPPRTPTVSHAPFSWTIFWLFSVVELGMVAGLFYLLFGGTPQSTKPSPFTTRQRFPWWGWGGLGFLGLFWILAWTRFAWFADLQGLTFTPLWLSFILVLNALTYQRTGRCLLLHQSRFFMSLFLWSATFWWYFEYLNRFVQNWHYIGLEPLTLTFYFLHSTVAFSTVLPAVLSTCDLLRTLRLGSGQALRLGSGQAFSVFTDRHYRRPLVLSHPATIAWSMLIVGTLCLFGLATWPNYLFSFLWVAPLFLMLSFQMLLGEDTIFSALAKGHWQIITIPACSALLCGFFWEMWNYYSAAKWVYSIPFVDGVEIFEMPILGYAGYLPFGVECVVAVDFFTRGRHIFDFTGLSEIRG